MYLSDKYCAFLLIIMVFEALWLITFLLIFLSWSGRHTCWGQPFRLCHMTTGRYMGLTEDKGLHLVDRDKADIHTTSFCFRASKVRSLM